MLLSATAETLDVLFWMRFFTGLGIGGALPNVAAIAAEAAPVRWRTTTVAILFSGFGFGSFVGGLVAAALVDGYGWQSVFVFGGVAALGILPILIMYLPPGRGGATSATQGSEPTKIMPLFALFHDGRARATALLWVIFLWV